MGPYLSERQQGTVREDYSERGDAWNYFTHGHARSQDCAGSHWPTSRGRPWRGLENLEAISRRLKDGGIASHPSEVKDPVTDRLKRSHSLQELAGKVHLKEYNAVASVNPDLARRTLEAQ